MQLSSLLKSKLRALPDKPGCYLMRDASGRIIYVGKAASLRRRIQSYFRAAGLRSASPKTRSLVHSVADIDIITARNEAAAILTESKLVKDYQPRFNILLRDDKRFPLLSINLNERWPRFRLCRIRRNDHSLYHAQRVIYFGPYLSSGAARTALEFIEKKFGLRKCTLSDPDENTHRHCINDIIRFCSAPCIGKISGNQYRKRINEALAFLRGERPILLNELKSAMDHAAAELNFEKAAVIRDTLEMLYSAVKHRAHVARTGGVSTENAQTGLADLQKTLGLNHRPMLIQAVDISNISGKHAVGSLVAAIAGVCRPALYRRFRIKTMEAVDDAAMMTEVISRHFKRLKDEGEDPRLPRGDLLRRSSSGYAGRISGAARRNSAVANMAKANKKMPDLLLVDGGIIQLQAALSILRNLGIMNVAVVGLAKKYEQIYAELKGKIRKIILPPNSPALQLLQRLRDEAHRFALAYHHRLRAKLIRESLLDEISGLGISRKQKLLRHFGSLRAIMRAPEKTIASLPGIGHVLSRKIKSFFKQQ